MFSRSTIVYLFLVLSVVTLLLSHTIQKNYGDIVPKSHFEMVNWMAFFTLIVTILPPVRMYILHA